MSKWIDADALKKDVARLHVLNDEAEIRRAYEYNPHVTSTDFEETLVSVFDAIDDAPTIEPKQGEWIPCSERLPEYRELVNVTTRDLRVKLAYLDSIQEDGTDDFWTMPLDDANCALWNIVAWMPLPEPWKEGE